jgi:hypothetical protein
VDAEGEAADGAGVDVGGEADGAGVGDTVGVTVAGVGSDRALDGGDVTVGGVADGVLSRGCEVDGDETRLGAGVCDGASSRITALRPTNPMRSAAAPHAATFTIDIWRLWPCDRG